MDGVGGLPPDPNLDHFLVYFQERTEEEINSFRKGYEEGFQEGQDNNSSNNDTSNSKKTNFYD